MKMENDKIKVSLVTTCMNEIDSVYRWRQDLDNQTRFPDEIVIVDSESSDGTVDVIRKWANEDERIKLIVKKSKVAVGRNIAIDKAKYDMILSTDMGTRLSSNWCEELIKPFERDESIQVVIGNTCIDIETVKSAVARAEYYIENGGVANPGPGSRAGNRSVAYLKKVWEELGGLPGDLTYAADDSVFGRQIIEAGYKTAYAPKAMTYWGRPQKLKQFWREQFVYGRGDGEALIKMCYAFKLHLKGMPAFLVSPLNGLRVMQKQLKLTAIKRALMKGDVAALLIMPILTFGNGWNFGKGYIIGYGHGNKHCLKCRKRLTKEFKIC